LCALVKTRTAILVVGDGCCIVVRRCVLLVNTHYGAYVGKFLEVVANHLDVIHIVHAEADSAIEDAVVGFDEYALHVYVEFLRDYVCNLIYNTHTIDTLDVYGYGEVQELVGTPLCGYEAIAIGGLKFGSLGTFTLVDDDLSVVVDVPEYIVARDGVAARCHVIGTL
jgi:hypothetical protein